MVEKRTSLEVIAPSVEEAIAKGLEELGIPEDAVEVEVLDAGSKGLFGIGTRQARVRLMIKTIPRDEFTSPPLVRLAAEKKPERIPAAEVEPIGEITGPGKELFEAIPEVEEEVTASEEKTAIIEGESLEQKSLQVARDTVQLLLQKMKVRARVTARFGVSEDEQRRPQLQVDINGDDLSVLIGHHAETLNALQYITSLILNKQVGRSVPLVVDVEGYRARRSEQIRRLAQRMADQAIKTGRRQMLEPMPASERRLVHIELRNNPDVKTESIGEEPRRKVTIVPLGHAH